MPGIRSLVWQSQTSCPCVIGLLVVGRYIWISGIGSSVLQSTAHAGAGAISVRYEGTAEYQGKRWVVTERLMLDDRALGSIGQALAGASLGPTSGGSEMTVIARQLAQYGWENAGSANGNPSLSRIRSLPSPVPPLFGSVAFRLPVVGQLTNSRLFKLIPDGESHLRIIARAGSVGATSPPNERMPLTDEREQLLIVIDPPESEQRSRGSTHEPIPSN
jgi:hypothetical protein